MNPAQKDYYAALGVPETASKQEIRKAHRTLVRTHHPDVNGGDKAAEQRFKDVQEAYDVLGDEAKRAEYDELRRNPFGRGEVGGFEGFGAPGRAGGTRYYQAPDGTHVRVETAGAGPDGGFVFNDGGFGGVGGIFSQFFGGGGEPGSASGRRARPRDTEAVLRLSFEEALHGGPREIRLPTGEAVRLNVPKGARSGLRLRLPKRGAGDAERGDLYIDVEVGPHPRFRRDGDDLYTAERISAVEAMLGTSRMVTNAYGQTVRLKIPPGTQPGRTLRLREQGVHTNSHTGDLLVEISVHVPSDLGDDALAELQAWAEKHGLAGESGA